MFVGWKENGLNIGNTNPIDILMDSDRTFTPIFQLIPVIPENQIPAGVAVVTSLIILLLSRRK